MLCCSLLSPKRWEVFILKKNPMKSCQFGVRGLFFLNIGSTKVEFFFVRRRHGMTWVCLTNLEPNQKIKRQKSFGPFSEVPIFAPKFEQKNGRQLMISYHPKSWLYAHCILHCFKELLGEMLIFYILMIFRWFLCVDISPKQFIADVSQDLHLVLRNPC